MIHKTQTGVRTPLSESIESTLSELGESICTLDEYASLRKDLDNFYTELAQFDAKREAMPKRNFERKAIALGNTLRALIGKTQGRDALDLYNIHNELSTLREELRKATKQ